MTTVVPLHTPERRSFTRPTRIRFDHRTRSFIGQRRSRHIDDGVAVDIEHITLWTEPDE